MKAAEPSLEHAQRSTAVAIAEAGVEAAHAGAAVTRYLASGEARRRLQGARRVIGLSVGKAAPAMHAALEQALPGGRLERGLVVGPEEHRETYAGASPYISGAHPLPDATSVGAARALRAFLAAADLREDDAVLLCLSGGASAMACEPREPLTLDELRDATHRFLRAGLDVTSINAVRQAVTTLGAGGLATAAWPARCLALIAVDNVQVGARAVGSGPTFPPLAAAHGAPEIVRRAALPPPLRRALLAAIDAGAASERRLRRTQNVVVCEPATALRGAERAARAAGYAPVTLSDAIQGEAREVAKVLGAVCRWHAQAHRPVCVLGAGEVTITMPDNCTGRGGRCQELAWAMAPEISGCHGGEFAAVASDGRDFIAAAGGAWVTSQTLQRLRDDGIDWRACLDAHDTYGALRAAGTLVPGARTGTNVCDLYVFTAA